MRIVGRLLDRVTLNALAVYIAVAFLVEQFRKGRV